MKAVIKTGGKQYLVSEGSVIFVEKLAGNEGEKVVFDEVLMLDSKVGNPYISKASVEGEILKQGKQKKIRVFKYSQKDRSNRRTHGHRQPYTKIEIKKIIFSIVSILKFYLIVLVFCVIYFNRLNV